MRRGFLLKPVAAAPPPPAAAVSSPPIRRPYVIDAASEAAVRLADNDFAESGSIYRRYQIQSEYWAPSVKYRQFSCQCGSCTSSFGGLCSGPIFSEGSGKNGVEEAL